MSTEKRKGIKDHARSNVPGIAGASLARYQGLHVGERYPRITPSLQIAGPCAHTHGEALHILRLLLGPLQRATSNVSGIHALRCAACDMSASSEPGMGPKQPRGAKKSENGLLKGGGLVTNLLDWSAISTSMLFVKLDQNMRVSSRVDWSSLGAPVYAQDVAWLRGSISHHRKFGE